MEIAVSHELLEICDKILAERRTTEEWAEIESDDMFQSPSYCGGFDADEGAFCFSFYDERRNEFWFQLTLEEVVTLIRVSSR
jgi:hypothetical protein